MARRSSPAVYRHPTIDDLLVGLPHDHIYRKFVDDMEEVLLENMFAGDKIPKRNVPRGLADKYSLQMKSPNFYNYDLAGGYRACYIISSCRPEDGTGPAPYILDLMSHEVYNKLYGYTK